MPKTISDLSVLNTPDNTAEVWVQDPTASVPVDRRWSVSAMKTVFINACYPVGVQYVQHASVDSDDPAIALPASESPATLFGGTWQALWDTESVYFRTEGTDADDGRINGLQLDQMQRLTGNASPSNNIGWYNAGNYNGVFTKIDDALLTNGVGATASAASKRLGFDSSQSPDARTSTTTDGETRVTNRLMRIWRRTA